MPLLRGETVGTAFVRILADGTNLPESIKEEFDRADPVAEAAGTRHSKRYEEAFNKELEKSMPHDLDRVLTESIARSDAIENFFNNSPRWKKITKRLEKDFGEAGLVIAHNLSEAVREGQDLGVIEQRLGNINREVIRANRQIVTAMRDEEEASHRLAIRLADAHTEANRMNAEFDRLKAKLASEAKGEDKVFSKSLLGRVEKLGHNLDLAGNKVGKFFGVGARNNFFNAFGKGVQGIVEGVARLFTGIGKVGEKFTEFRKLFSDAGGGFKGFAAVAQNAGLSVAKLATGLVALVVLVGLIITAAGLFSAVLSGLVAAITAVSGAIVFGLIGALAPLVGLLPVLAFGIGTVALGFAGLNKAGKKALAESIKPLSKEFSSLRQAAAKGLFSEVTRTAKELTPVIKNLRPLFHDIGTAIADVVLDFADAANSPGFRRFTRSMDTFIPKAIRILGSTAKEVFAGLGPLFEELEPFALSLLRSVRGIADRFAAWSSSKKGREEVRDFLSRAAHSAGELVGLLRAAGGLLLTLLGGGQDTGNSIIADLTNQLNTWNTELKDPKNKKAISDWFANGKQVVEDLGNVVTAIAGVVHELDSPSNRKAAHQFMDFMTTAFHAVALATHVLDVPFLSLVGTIKFVATSAHLLKVAWDGAMTGMRTALATMVHSVLAGFGTLLDGAVHALGWIPGIGPKLKKARDDFKTWAQSVENDIRGIPNHFTVTGILKLNVDAIKGAHLSAQATAKALEIAFDRLEKGGAAMAGVPYLVGEKGAELFIPNVSGVVVPNNDPAVQAFLQGQRTGTTTTHVNNSRTSTMGGITIITPTEDPRRVADEVVNRLAAATI